MATFELLQVPPAGLPDIVATPPAHTRESPAIVWAFATVPNSKKNKTRILLILSQNYLK